MFHQIIRTMTKSPLSNSDRSIEERLLRQDTEEKSFSNILPVEMEKIAIEAVTKAKKRMHDKDLYTVFSDKDQNVYKELPSGSVHLIHERSKV